MPEGRSLCIDRDYLIPLTVPDHKKVMPGSCEHA